MDYLIVAAIGIFSGGVELVTRYRDNPWRAVCSLPGSLYLAINIGAAVMALFFITDVFDWKLGFEDNPVALAGSGWCSPEPAQWHSSGHRCSPFG